MFEVDVTVIGGGVIGCAVAEGLARRGRVTVLLEQERGLARSTTSRNSEVNHGGMYYPAGSLKAELCVRGRRLLKSFCLEHGVGYQEYGKLIVATAADQVDELQRLYVLGQANGVEDLELLDRAGLRACEPQVTGVAALLSPRTGVLDAEQAAKTLAKLAEGQGARIMVGASVTGLEPSTGGWQVTVSPGDGGLREGWRHRSRCVVNAAGLWSDRVAAMAGVDVAARGWNLILSRGSYFAIDPRHARRVRRLVYPVPPADGSTLGVHLCLDLGGRMKLGPDLEVLAPDPRSGRPACGLEAIFDYGVDPGRRDAFFAGASAFLPWLEPEDLAPDMSGIRPKLSATDFRDFVIEMDDGERQGLLNLLGIDSPGLTCSLAIAERACELVAEVLG